MSKRKDVEKFILENIQKIDPSGTNKKLYEDLFKEMNNKEFDEFMTKLKNDDIVLSIIAPNKSKVKLDVKRNIKIAKELGYNFFQKLYIGPKDKDTPMYKTNVEYMILDLPFRRAAQMLIKKISIPEDNQTVDVFTGQVTGKSRGGKLTYPEIQLLAGMGLDNTIKELLSARGGDRGKQRAMEASLSKYGQTNLELLDQYATGVVSTKTLKAYFNAMMLKNTL